MSSLQEKSIASVRATLLRATSEHYCSMWRNAVTTVKGGNEYDIFEDMLSRDVLAYITCRFMFLQNHSVCGGFVRSHYSGKPWNDIDIMLAGGTHTHKLVVAADYILMGNLIDFVNVILGLPKYQMSYTIHSKGPYGKSVDFKVQLDDRDNIVIKLDLVSRDAMIRASRVVSRLPVTAGSCLEFMSQGCVRIRTDNTCIMRRMSHYDISDIVDLLRNGQDVKLCLKGSFSSTNLTKQYRNYYWCRIAKMMSLQWKFVAIDGPEPNAMTEEELGKAMREMTWKKVKEASQVEE